MRNTKRVVKVTTSEIEIITRHYTYEVIVEEAMADEFMEKMSELCGHKEIYEVLNNHVCKYITRKDGKQYPSDENFSSSIDKVELLNQPAWSL
ncbi:hypothetical protein [Sulfurimonas xiamenensis]|uniref:Uncharacterized protein n=1 Tax=Sulfurimonas xiamenensis TaxID=2590021 RepID=A0AAJ4DN74_9BACT|nr:hypothetical protein [Sulfurimonas xiamenensis]QFR43761.1 hypothetical protein FJR47_07495 [Sulfurimonas xiamenensis]